MRLSIIALVAACSASANASITFHMQYSGASFGNTAAAHGTITLDETLLPNPGFSASLNPVVLGLTLTVTGAGSGNGVFTASDFSSWIWDTNGGTLNLNTQLIGQATQGDPWGTSGYVYSGDFNLFANPSSNAPTGSFPFGLTAANGSQMLLTSFSSVPEPSTYGVMLGGLALAGAIVRRRRKTA